MNVAYAVGHYFSMLPYLSLILEILEDNSNYANALVQNSDAEIIPVLSRMLSVRNRDFHEHAKRMVRKNAALVTRLFHRHTRIPTCMVRAIFSPHPINLCTSDVIASVVAYLQQNAVCTEQKNLLVCFLWAIILRLHTHKENVRQTIFRCIDMKVLSREDLCVAEPLVGMTEAQYLRHCAWLSKILLDGTNSVDETFAMTEHTTEALRMFTEYRHQQKKQFRTVPVYILTTFQNLCLSPILSNPLLNQSNAFYNLLCFVRYHISTLQFDSVQFQVFLTHAIHALAQITVTSEHDETIRHFLNMLIDSMQSVAENTECQVHSCGLFLDACFLIIGHVKNNRPSLHLVSLWALTTAFVNLTMHDPKISEALFSCVIRLHFECLEDVGSAVPPALELHNLRWLAGKSIPGAAKQVLIQKLLEHIQTLHENGRAIELTCACFDATVYYMEMHGGIFLQNADKGALYARSISVARRILVKRYYMSNHNTSETDMLSSVVRFIQVMVKWTSFQRTMFKPDFVSNTIRDVMATLDESVGFLAFSRTEHLIPNVSGLIYLIARMIHSQKICKITVLSSTLCAFISMALRWESQKIHFAEFSQQLCNSARFMVRNQNTRCSLQDLSFVGTDFDLNTLTSDTCISLLLLVTHVAVLESNPDTCIEKITGPLPSHLQSNSVLKYALFQSLVTSYKTRQPKRTYTEAWASFLQYITRVSPDTNERDMYYNLRFASFFFLLTKATYRTCFSISVAEFLNDMWMQHKGLFSQRICVHWLKVANIVFIAWPCNTQMQLRNALMKVVQSADIAQSPRILELQTHMIRFAMHEYDLDVNSKQKLFGLCFETKPTLETKNSEGV